jgi:transposase InsO family protein
MKLHRNAKLGLSGRFALVQACEAGLSVRAVARRFSVSPATVSRWSCRWRAASEQERRSLACLFDRSSLSRPARRGREPERRYEWPCPGDLVHMDVTLYGRFERPGHAVTGDRRRTAAEKRARVGYDYAHAIVDDHSRLAYAELLADERAGTVTGFVERALQAFAARGIEPKRLMTDNAWAYTKNRSLRQLLERRGIRHLTTKPHRPRTNGKVERFHQTMAREWAYGLRYRSSRHRAAALPHWLRYYNERRPHSSLGGLAPISRVHNVRGQDN